jgi:hypothetical protein
MAELHGNQVSTTFAPACCKNGFGGQVDGDHVRRKPSAIVLAKLGEQCVPEEVVQVRGRHPKFLRCTVH